MMNEEKQKALEAALGHIEKQYGKGSVMKLGDSSSNMVVEAVPTGSLGLDIALGVGGVPKGRIVEIYGPESSGKTTGFLHSGLQRYRSVAEQGDLSMQSMHLIRFLCGRISALTSITSIFHSRITVSRHLKSPRRWYVPVQLTS